MGVPRNGILGMSTWQFNVGNWEPTVTAWRVTLLSARVVPVTEPATRLGTNHSNMVWIVTVTLTCQDQSSSAPSRREEH